VCVCVCVQCVPDNKCALVLSCACVCMCCMCVYVFVRVYVYLCRVGEHVLVSWKFLEVHVCALFLNSPTPKFLPANLIPDALIQLTGNGLHDEVSF
jgi:hypothetical protein